MVVYTAWFQFIRMDGVVIISTVSHISLLGYPKN